MNATKNIKITNSRLELTAWKRVICFEYEGEHHEVVLFWNEFDGFELYWLELSKTPDWAVNWNEDEHEGMSLADYLDELTWERK